jgi:cytochrome c5
MTPRFLIGAVFAAATVMAAAPVLAAAPADNGKAVYDAHCAMCHNAGIAGAPKVGDKAAWAPRVKLGDAALLAAAIKGIKAMPPRGGCAKCSDADMKAAVDWMASQSK